MVTCDECGKAYDINEVSGAAAITYSHDGSVIYHGCTCPYCGATKKNEVKTH
jgi:hypothetical protein